MIAPDIFKKLRLDANKTVLIINAPAEYQDILKDITYDNEFNQSKAGLYDFVQVFANKQSELEELTKSVATAGKYDCLFWACYPKGGGKIKSDIKRDTVWTALGLANLRPVSQIAIDETWSALRGRPHDAVGK